MGVDTVLRLHARTQLSEVADVLGKLLGCKSSIEPLSGGSIFCKVDGVSTKAIDSLPTCVHITVDNGKGFVHQFLYHFESDDGSHIIMERSSAFAIALFVRMVNWFGGNVETQDCGGDMAIVSRGYVYAFATHGRAWEYKERMKDKIIPLTLVEVKDCQKYAAYPWSDWMDETLSQIGAA